MSNKTEWTPECIRAEIKRLEEQRRPIDQQINTMELRLARAESLRWIRANNCRREDVQFSDEGDAARIGTFCDFLKWMRETGSTKRFIEWSGRLYIAAEVSGGRISHISPGRAKDLED